MAHVIIDYYEQSIITTVAEKIVVDPIPSKALRAGLLEEE